MRLLKSWRLVLLGLVFGMAVILSNCGTPSNTVSNNSPTGPTPAAVPAGALVYGAGGALSIWNREILLMAIR